MEPHAIPLISTLRTTISFVEMRTSADRVDYFEAVLLRSELERCVGLVSEVFGPPVKPFGQTGTLAPTISLIVERLGGIRVEQCLFLKSLKRRGLMTYAAFWPWASNPQRITLKVGFVES